MQRTAIKARPAEVVLGHCEFCNCNLEMQVMASSRQLTPFGECASCRRFTIWGAAEVSSFISSIPLQRRAS